MFNSLLEGQNFVSLFSHFWITAFYLKGAYVLHLVEATAAHWTLVWDRLDIRWMKLHLIRECFI